MSLRDDNLRLALTKAITDVITEAMQTLRADHFETLLDRYDEEGTKQFTVKLPDGTKVATITLTEQKESYEVTDKVAFLEWMRRNREDSIETVEMPAQDAWTYDQVKPRAETALLKSLEHVGDMPFDPATGELVEGVTYKAAGRPKTFSVRYDTDGRAQVIDAWRTGQLTELVGSDVLPRIEA